jgi:lipopolysaccharide/colanic/teichoic acid biosynthesis glycosyltransferase
MDGTELLSYDICGEDDRHNVNIKIERSVGVSPKLDFKYEKKPVFDFFKRAADIVLSLLALIVLSPILLIVCLAVMIKDFGSPFFSQERVGRDGRIFKIYKIRSMYKDAEEKKAELMEKNESGGNVFKIKNDPRVLGRVGNFIRKTSIDELPQLVNILVGDMSIIGPRPFVPSEQANLADERLLVRPGLSCYWQVNGKNELSAEMSDYYDKKYIMDRSVLTDVSIIFKTVGVVLKSENE